MQGKHPQAPVDYQAWASHGMAGWREGAPAPVPGGAPAGAPELKLAGEASLGPVDSQVWFTQVTAGWRKAAPAPGSRGCLAGAPEAKLAGEASLGAVDSQVWVPQGRAGWRKAAPVPGTGGCSWTQTGRGSLPGPGGFPRMGTSGYGRLEEGSAHPRAQWGPAWGPEAKLAGEASPGPVDSQFWAPQGTAGWKTRAPTPGPVGAQPGPLKPDCQGKPPWAQ
ncbi:hypothetical protein NDU88_006228 [Pleurodeles waltl]|uniref:Uncharacterized protein n=1 Tax=Pleurodeles waltl TaxID=8319 RepID=A0AAV7UKD5_PLEWA|nr:hypothetical protein NDU88_006228 [Pleurodeles waltl]